MTLRDLIDALTNISNELEYHGYDPDNFDVSHIVGTHPITGEVYTEPITDEMLAYEPDNEVVLIG